MTLGRGIFLLLAIVQSVHSAAFNTKPDTGHMLRNHFSGRITTTSFGLVALPSQQRTSLNMGGFGSGGGTKKKGAGKKKKGPASIASKLKPKSQWDRYMANKDGTAFTVAVRVIGDGEERGEWLKVGRVKSEKDEFTEVAVAKQRALIAEHSKRLFPLKVLPKDRVEWAYTSEESDEWTQVVPKDVGEEAQNQAGIEKKIGFEGIGDPATGFYCHYSEGRLVDKEGSDENLTGMGARPKKIII
eukprot:CAMPEP_0195508684 /NCGR_PEP_ID=MMETSP0794_2-20130614/1824_1 /TAXON_ID=515487 /ORGANISM="Stephanopyxis turris, Strain CCMP 815" /LENGTH=242 /DNA_ID=CAMNT_0040635707 /DNA_START=109 /DNA_END=837 /DNA_ORIENTATION=+